MEKKIKKNSATNVAENVDVAALELELCQLQDDGKYQEVIDLVEKLLPTADKKLVGMLVFFKAAALFGLAQFDETIDFIDSETNADMPSMKVDPLDTLAELEAIRDLSAFKIKERDKPVEKMSVEQIKEAIRSGNEALINKALVQLREQNLRLLQDEVAMLLIDPRLDLITRFNLLQALETQEINHKFDFLTPKKNVKVNPIHLDSDRFYNYVARCRHLFDHVTHFNEASLLDLYSYICGEFFLSRYPCGDTTELHVTIICHYVLFNALGRNPDLEELFKLYKIHQASDRESITAKITEFATYFSLITGGNEQ